MCDSLLLYGHISPSNSPSPIQIPVEVQFEVENFFTNLQKSFKNLRLNMIVRGLKSLWMIGEEL